MTKNNNKIKSVTLGCRFNFYESEVAKSMINKISPNDDVIIVNTCTVTHEAERQSKQAVRKAIRENPDAKVIVTGCAVKTSGDYFRNLDGVFSVIDNDSKDDINSYACLSDSDVEFDFDETEVQDSDPLFLGKARVFIQIQNGCDHFCSYCIIPFTRGKSRSLPIERVLRRVGYFVENGFKEIVLSGIDLTSYGSDFDEKTDLADVLKSILKEYPSVERLRISSIDPEGISDGLFDLMAFEKRIMPHFHLSIQSGDNSVLKSMRRRHTREKVVDVCSRLRSLREDVVFGADFIVGFPTETEEMFENTIKLIDEAEISLLHVFPFSKREGTLAESFIQLPKKILRQRAEKLRQKADDVKLKLLESFVGKKVNFIVEKNENDFSLGKTDHFIAVKVKKMYNISRVIYNAEVESTDGEFLYIK